MTADVGSPERQMVLQDIQSPLQLGIVSGR